MHFVMETSPSPSAPFTPEQTAWINGFMAGLASCGRVVLPTEMGGGATAKPSSGGHSVGGFSKDNPFPAPMKVNRLLNGEGSIKDTRHFEFDLTGSGLTYEVGDALGVCPSNWPEYVEELIKALGFKGDESVPLPSGGSAPTREAFLKHYDITKPSRNFIEAVAQRSNSPNLKRLLDPSVSGDLSKYLWGREVIDLLLEFPAAKFTPAEFVSFMKKLAPRLYSIASSIKAHPNQVHLTVAIVRYEAVGRKRKGVCSTFMAERVEAGKPAPVFMHSNKNFRLPSDPNRPIILIGPGTGIAPFRAFLEDRRATGAKGKNWVYFGDQHYKSDFLYREEFEAMMKDGFLTKLSTAFSRDQAEKIYVQNRMTEEGAEFFKWLEEGAHVYVCGDASRMAKDVDVALNQLIEKHGGKTTEEAAAYVAKLKSEKRYQRDVY